MERDYDRERERQPKGHSLGGTGGAVPVKNEKGKQLLIGLFCYLRSIKQTCIPTTITLSIVQGEITMQKVKVQRYIAGRRPKYAGEISDEEELSNESEEEQTPAPVHYQPDLEAIQANTGGFFTSF